MSKDIENFPFDEDFWMLIAPMNAGGSTIGYIDEICGEGGKLSSAKTTRAEAGVLVEYYLKELDRMHFFFNEYGVTGSREVRMDLYANKRINDLVESGAISEECVSEMSDRIFGDND